MNTLYVSDLDGTLVNNQAELSDFALSSLREMISAGLSFSVASARSIVSMQQMLRGLHLPLPVISFNGAFLSDIATGQHKIVNSIIPNVAVAIYACLDKYDSAPFLSTFDGNGERVYYDRVRNDGMQWYLEDRIKRKDPRFQRIQNLSSGLNEPVTCMTIINRKEILDELELELVRQFSGQVEIHHIENQYSPGWYWLTVHDIRASKDQAIHSLKELCGIQHCRVVVFGDNNNDIKMFQNADHAVAVSNANDKVKQHANEIIGDNEQDSVIHYLRANWQP